MKRTQKWTAAALSAALMVSLAACSGGGTTSTPSSAPSQNGGSGDGTSSGESYVVGICQLAPHDALDAATQGFKDALTERFGESVKFSEGNAGGDSNNCITIVDGFLSEGVDLILANATASLTAAQSATDTIPILGTAITNYGVALNLDTTEDTVLGSNISGTSDLAPLDQQAALLQELFPETEYPNVGLLYCSAEPNSIFQVETIQGYLEDMGYTCSTYAFTDVNDLSSVTQSACDSSDVIYIPTDNTAANNTETIANVVIPAGVPVVAGESGICWARSPARWPRVSSPARRTCPRWPSSATPPSPSSITPTTVRLWASRRPTATSPSRNGRVSSKTAGKGLPFPAAFCYTSVIY